MRSTAPSVPARSLSRTMLRFFLGGLAVAAATGLLAVLGAVSANRGLQFAGSAAVVAGACLLTFVHAVAIDRGRLVVWMRAASAAAWLGAAAWLLLIWTADASLGPAGTERVARVAGALSLAALMGALAGLTLLSRAGGTWVRVVRVVALGLTIVWGIFGEVTFAFPDAVGDFVNNVLGESLFGRMLVASIIVGATSLLAQPVLLRLGHMASHDAGGALRGRHVRVRLACPRCGVPCEVDANTAAECPACRLDVRVEFEEPRCACGYLLYALEGEACPECGAAVPAGKRWAGASVTP